MRTPLATYRLQFHRRFRIDAARRLLPYLEELGVRDVYASPLTAARRGSGHGYDVIDPNRINPEVGSERSLAALAGALHSRGMGLLLDIVPNHMAAVSENLRWRDVMARGIASPYAGFFDIDWDRPLPGSENRIVLPLLGRRYRESLEKGDFRIALQQGELLLACGNLRLPLDIRTWGFIIRPALERATRGRGRAASQRPLVRALDRIDRGPASRGPGFDAMAWWSAREIEIRRRLAASCGAHPVFRRALQEEIERTYGGNDRRPDRKALSRLLAMQNYRLIHWRDAGALINYRRFFNVNDLVCLRMEERHVFEEWHGLVLRLVRARWINGLRIDHVDGLRDPGRYLRRLRAACGRPVYTVVEKILCGDERLPARSAVAGTTGYDFLNILNRLFVSTRGAAALRRSYTRFTGDRRRFEDLVYRAKRRLLATDFRGQMRVLGDMFIEFAAPRRRAPGLTERRLRAALELTTASLPVYRTYVDGGGAADSDRAVVHAAIENARRRAPSLPPAAFAAVERVLLPRRIGARAARRDDRRTSFILRWQQLTGPLMAKGHEDTALYIDHHCTSLNEVGGSPGQGGLSIASFHELMIDRLRRGPATMNATSTHDTKRGEDVRARINVLSEIPDEWEARLLEWHRWNRKARTRVRGTMAPTRAEEVLIYQTMLGAWPADRREVRGFGARLKEYLVKAAREAKERSTWDDPSIAHENALRSFVDIILDPVASKRFLASFHGLRLKVARAGALNSISQVVIKATAPGIPDFYQGSELWDLSLVDPDNRRLVDFDRRQSLLAGLRKRVARDRAALLRELLVDPLDVRIKLYAIWQALRLRKEHPELFLRGRYLPIAAEGRSGESVCAYARRLRTTWVMTVAPRLRASRICAGERDPVATGWSDSHLRLPAGTPVLWRNALTGHDVRSTTAGRGNVLPLTAVLNDFPVALLVGGA